MAGRALAALLLLAHAAPGAVPTVPFSYLRLFQQVAQLKDRVEELTGVFARHQKLIFKGKVRQF